MGHNQEPDLCLGFLGRPSPGLGCSGNIPLWRERSGFRFRTANVRRHLLSGRVPPVQGLCGRSAASEPSDQPGLPGEPGRRGKGGVGSFVRLGYRGRCFQPGGLCAASIVQAGCGENRPCLYPP